MFGWVGWRDRNQVHRLASVYLLSWSITFPNMLFPNELSLAQGHEAQPECMNQEIGRAPEFIIVVSSGSEAEGKQKMVTLDRLRTQRALEAGAAEPTSCGRAPIARARWSPRERREQGRQPEVEQRRRRRRVHEALIERRRRIALERELQTRKRRRRAWGEKAAWARQD